MCETLQTVKEQTVVKESECNALTEKLVDKESECDALTEKLLDKESECDALTEKLVDKKSECDALTEKLVDKESECDALTENEVTVSEPDEFNLLDMPVEIILKILTLLDVKFLKDTVSKVCKRFEDILADNRLWKYWVYSKIEGCYPPIPKLKIYEDNPIDWEEVCIEIDVEKNKWLNATQNFRHIVVKDVHYASVDTVLLINGGKMCISGGRDRSIALWNIMDFKLPDTKNSNFPSINTKPKYIIHDAHSGWVWDLTTDNLETTSIVYSASWDNTVKAWDLRRGFHCMQTFSCGMSALCAVTCDKIVMAGLYSKKILSFDLRSGASPINAYRAHRGPVLSLNCFDNMIASVSEDKTLAIWDRTAGKIMKSDIKIPTDKGYPVCINWKSGALYIGDSKGCLHLFNPENHTFVTSHEIWPESSVIEPPNKIAGCYQTDGNIIVCSDRGEIKFLYNSSPPQPYSSIQTSTFDVTQLRYLNGILVTGTCDSALEFWVPKERYLDL